MLLDLLSLPFSFITHLTPPMPISSLSNRLAHLPMNLPSQHWNMPSTNRQQSSVINQALNFMSYTSQVSSSQPPLYPYAFKNLTWVPFSILLQTFDGIDFRQHPETFLNGIKTLMVLFCNLVPNLQIVISMASETFKEWLLLLLPSMTLFHFDLIVALKPIPKTSLSFQQTFYCNLVVQPSNLKLKSKPMFFNWILLKLFSFLFAVLKIYSIRDSLNSTQNSGTATNVPKRKNFI